MPRRSAPVQPVTPPPFTIACTLKRPAVSVTVSGSIMSWRCEARKITSSSGRPFTTTAPLPG